LIIYLHGFSSVGWGNKSKYIAQHFKGKVFAPDYAAHDPHNAISFLQHYLEDLKQQTPTESSTLLVGSSMGGFYANWFAQNYGYNCVMINPAITPWLTLTNYIGENVKYGTNEKFIFSKEMLEASKDYAFDPTNSNEVSRLVLLDKGDELIDYRKTKTLFKNIAKIITYDDGDHRFSHMKEAFPEILKIAEES